MNTILAPLLRKGVHVFIDDFLIYNSTLQEHVVKLRQVFETLDRHQLKIKKPKCSFARQQLTYLGHIISKQREATNMKNIEVVCNWLAPTNVKEVYGFLGLASYYRKFVQIFGLISIPLTNLLKKQAVFVWTAEKEVAFQALKDALVTAPVLALLDFKKKFDIETDASDKGIGAVLMQEGHPVAYLSKSLGPCTQGLSTHHMRRKAWQLFSGLNTRDRICSKRSSL